MCIKVCNLNYKMTVKPPFRSRKKVCNKVCNRRKND